MSRILTQQLIYQLNKFSQKTTKVAKRSKILLEDGSHHASRDLNALGRRFCHIETQVNSNQLDTSKTSGLQSKILHATAYQSNGKAMLYFLYHFYYIYL